ncbi:ArpA protein [Streptomyces sp. NBC_00212]|uniref:HalD/BesD family halogenase n=1 Tax=Streptomyces sp. NBC_00212 TaxID=2975684 RepID=UPI003252ADF6
MIEASAARADNVVDALEQHLVHEVPPLRLQRARREFLTQGFVKTGFLAPYDVKKLVAEESESLISRHAVRRDSTFEATGGTPRRMHNVRRAEIAEYGRILPRLYSSPGLREALGVVAGEDVLECPYAPEQFVITELTQSGDTHGWHWDDYSFALVWVVDCPPVEQGGFVQCVPRTEWDKENPQLNRHFVSQPIQSVELRPGDLYFLRSDTTLHRVYPVTGGRRLIVNMGYAARRDLAKSMSHETMDALWADPADGRPTAYAPAVRDTASRGTEQESSQWRPTSCGGTSQSPGSSSTT